jgi:hypothetical protein
MTLKKILKTIIRSNQPTLKQSPATEYKHQQQSKAEQSQRHSTANTAKIQGRCSVLQPVFLSWFL